MKNETYDKLKYFAQIFLPALTFFVGVVLKCFNYNFTDVVITIMTAFDTFLGTILGISSKKYNENKGE